MVAISFTEPEKEGQVQEEQPVQGQIQGEAPLLPCTLQEVRSRGRENGRAGNRG